MLLIGRPRRKKKLTQNAIDIAMFLICGSTENQFSGSANQRELKPVFFFPDKVKYLGVTQNYFHSFQMLLSSS